MPYLVEAELSRTTAGQRLRDLLARPGILQMPGAQNGMAAIQAKRAGFDALYLSGAAMTASMGIPDLGIITVDEVAFFIRQVVRAADLPILVDGDTGYGEALNVMHMVRVFEGSGAAAVQIEDQHLPKKCGHLNDKKLATAEDMATKVAAAAKARRDMVIVARTDAAATEGMEKFGYTNPMQVPKINKIVLNIGAGEAASDQKKMAAAVNDLTAIAGQKVIVTRAKKAIASFKIREGLPIGAKVTLRRDKMYEFLDRLITTALPRVRDFRGLNGKSFDGRGNYAMGLKEHIVFVEIDYDKTETVWGMDIIFNTTARTDEEAKALLEGFQFPFMN